MVSRYFKVIQIGEAVPDSSGAVSGVPQWPNGILPSHFFDGAGCDHPLYPSPGVCRSSTLPQYVGGWCGNLLRNVEKHVGTPVICNLFCSLSGMEGLCLHLKATKGFASGHKWKELGPGIVIQGLQLEWTPDFFIHWQPVLSNSYACGTRSRD